MSHSSRAHVRTKSGISQPAENEKEGHGPAGPRREGGRVNANAQPQSTRTCSSLCFVCTNVDSLREEFLIRVADSSPEFTVEPIVL